MVPTTPIDDGSSEKKEELKEYNGCSIRTYFIFIGPDGVYFQIKAWNYR